MFFVPASESSPKGSNPYVLTADDIIKALARKHSREVFVPECKDGPSYGRGEMGLVRMDAWVMPRSWSKPWCTAYEVKVSRSDFLNDDKWTAYLELCHYFYFVCPWGLIQPDEVGTEVGLRWVTQTGSRVITKKKAPLRRDVIIPETLWRYVLMCRARITERDIHYRVSDNVDYWRRWLEEKAEKRKLGWAVSKAIKDLVHNMEAEVRRMKSRVEDYEYVRQRLTELGFDPHQRVGSWAFRTVEERLGVKAPVAVLRASSHMRDCLDAFESAMAKAGLTAPTEGG